MGSRNFIIARRGNAVNDISKVTLTGGKITYDGDDFIKSLKTNHTYNMGLGTETEMGLEPNRYPIRVILENGSHDRDEVHTVVKGWRVIRITGEAVPFTRRADVNGLAIRNLYHVIPELDDMLHEHLRVVRNAAYAQNPQVDGINTTLFNTLKLANLTAEQKTQVKVAVDAIKAACTAGMMYLKIGDNAYLTSYMHSGGMTTEGAWTAIRKIATEMALTYKANYVKFAAGYPDLPSGAHVYSAYAVAWYFKQGLYEAYESKEYHTVTCKVSDTKMFEISAVNFRDGFPAPEHLQVGKVIDLTGVTYDRTILRAAPAGVFCAALNHYQYNHTTVGSKLSGPLLSLMCSLGLFAQEGGHALEESQTRLAYETFHPVNKRALANLFFKGCAVTTYGKPSGSPTLQRLELDQFLKIREKPNPAGSHKAFIAGAVMKRVLNQNLGPFLPWVAEINNVIDCIRTVATCGARAHIGSSYYTGFPSLCQGAALDAYMPELAAFMNITAARDTLCMSPHLGPDVAARADQGWVNILKTIKGKDLSSLKTETITEFLTTSGTVRFTFDPEKKETWAAAIGEGVAAARILEGIMEL